MSNIRLETRLQPFRADRHGQREAATGGDGRLRGSCSWSRQAHIAPEAGCLCLGGVRGDGVGLMVGEREPQAKSHRRALGGSAWTLS